MPMLVIRFPLERTRLTLCDDLHAILLLQPKALWNASFHHSMANLPHLFWQLCQRVLDFRTLCHALHDELWTLQLLFVRTAAMRAQLLQVLDCVPPLGSGFSFFRLTWIFIPPPKYQVLSGTCLFVECRKGRIDWAAVSLKKRKPSKRRLSFTWTLNGHLPACRLSFIQVGLGGPPASPCLWSLKGSPESSCWWFSWPWTAIYQPQCVLSVRTDTGSSTRRLWIFNLQHGSPHLTSVAARRPSWGGDESLGFVLLGALLEQQPTPMPSHPNYGLYLC